MEGIKRCKDCYKIISTQSRCPSCKVKSNYRTKKWRERKKEYLKCYSKDYRTKHKEILLANDKKRYLTNLGYFRKKGINYYNNHKEKLQQTATERGKKYYTQNKNNPVFKQKLIARKLVKKIKLEGVCELCHKEIQEHRHHLDYSSPLNIIKICGKCHKKVHRKY